MGSDRVNVSIDTEVSSPMTSEVLWTPGSTVGGKGSLHLLILSKGKWELRQGGQAIETQEDNQAYVPGFYCCVQF